MSEDQLSDAIASCNSLTSSECMGKGFVYVMSCGDQSLPLKIGKTSDPRARLRHHRRSSGRDLSIERLIVSDNATSLERIVLCSVGKYSMGGEWFSPSIRMDKFFQSMIGADSVYLNEWNLPRNSVIATGLLRQALNINGVIERRNGRHIRLPQNLPNIVGDMERDRAGEYGAYKLRISNSINELESQVVELKKLQSEIGRAISRRRKGIDELRKANDNLSKGIAQLSFI